jgi:hypothetical protein
MKKLSLMVAGCLLALVGCAGCGKDKRSGGEPMCGDPGVICPLEAGTDAGDSGTPPDAPPADRPTADRHPVVLGPGESLHPKAFESRPPVRRDSESGCRPS